MNGALGDAWRIALTFAALGALPLIWYRFLNQMGDFGDGVVEGGRPQRLNEEVSFATIAATEERFAGVTRFVRVAATISLGIAVLFTNIAMPYIVVRFGWGYGS